MHFDDIIIGSTYRTRTHEITDEEIGLSVPFRG
jgi:hypothetical protein